MVEMFLCNIWWERIRCYSCSLVSDMQLLDAIQRSTHYSLQVKLASSAQDYPECHRLSSYLTYIGIRYVRYRVFEFTSYIVFSRERNWAKIKYLVRFM